MGKQHRTSRKNKKEHYISRNSNKTELKVFLIKKVKDEEQLEKNLIRTEFDEKKTIDVYSFLSFKSTVSNLIFYQNSIRFIEMYA